jgi:acetyl-CoA carboxylase biotin carboxylase subunit
MRCTPAMDSRGECLFRRIIEEAPAPGWQPRHRREDHAGRHAAGGGRRKHANAGTVEFLMDEDEYFYFIEMNAPGVDPVKEQLKVAGVRGHR